MSITNECGKIVYASMEAAYQAMMIINRRSHGEGSLLRGIYPHAGHWHTTRRRGKRRIMAAAAEAVLNQLTRP